MQTVDAPLAALAQKRKPITRAELEEMVARNNWNEVEYEGLNENFRDRGARSEEQIALLRALWSDTAISFKGRWHTIDNAGINGYARAAGRDPATIGLEPQLSVGRLPEGEWAGFVEGWRQLGATHLCINTMGAGLHSLDEHIAMLRRVKETLGL